MSGQAIGRDPEARARLDALVKGALDELEVGYERTDEGSFLVRLEGEHKLATMTWLVVGDHTLLVEAFFMRCPDDKAPTYEFLLERNARAYGVHFTVDSLGDIWLVGHVPLAAVTPDEIDRLLACVLTYSDGNFDQAIKLGFAEAIRQEQAWRAKIAAEESTGRLDVAPDTPR